MVIKKPTIFIYAFRPDAAILKEICAGMEEEGVFYEVFNRDTQSADALAGQAANDSMLGCGIGLSEKSATLRLGKPEKGCNLESYASPTAEQGRTLGANAARAIKRQALKN